MTSLLTKIRPLVGIIEDLRVVAKPKETATGPPGHWRDVEKLDLYPSFADYVSEASKLLGV